jgi:hypothetical protein
MARLVKRLRSWRPGLGRRRRPGSEVPSYSVRPTPDGVLYFTARGDQPGAVHVLVETVRALTGVFGVVLVEVHGPSREWTAEGLDRGRVLGALLQLRDLWGRGLLDLAVFSPTEGVELFLDRFGTLEIRTGSWNEARVKALLGLAGFRSTRRLATLPSPVADPAPWDADARDRVARVKESLGLQAPAPEPEARDVP